MSTEISIPLEQLPPVRGRLSEKSLLSKVTWFQVGGPADIVFKPADLEDLQAFLKHCPPHIPVYPIGVGSNLLVRDGGLNAVVIRLGREFTDIRLEEDGSIIAGAAALDLSVAKFAAKHGRTGVEFFAGIPGTIGGALRMNAGAYGNDTNHCLMNATVVTREGELKTIAAKDMGFTYRHCEIPEDWIFVAGRFKTAHGDPETIQAAMQDIQDKRSASQPIRSRTGGSTFRNPEGYSAWKLVDEAGMRGKIVGGAQMSELHCNFMINQGDACSADLENLGETVRQAVRDTSGIELIWEIKRIGRHRSNASHKGPEDE